MPLSSVARRITAATASSQARLDRPTPGGFEEGASRRVYDGAEAPSIIAKVQNIQNVKTQRQAVLLACRWTACTARASVNRRFGRSGQSRLQISLAHRVRSSQLNAKSTSALLVSWYGLYQYKIEDVTSEHRRIGEYGRSDKASTKKHHVGFKSVLFSTIAYHAL